MDWGEHFKAVIQGKGVFEVNPLQENILYVEPQYYFQLASDLRHHLPISFEQLVDLTIVDRLTYGQSEWKTHQASAEGFSRARLEMDFEKAQQPGRFELVAHLLSYKQNVRLRLKSIIPSNLEMPSLISLWPSANWLEREAFDMFGIIFNEHDDLRRILTDYGFTGHPFRKDFPMVGEEELRYDHAEQRCIYEPNSIEDRTLVPKVIR